MHLYIYCYIQTILVSMFMDRVVTWLKSHLNSNSYFFVSERLWVPIFFCPAGNYWKALGVFSFWKIFKYSYNFCGYKRLKISFPKSIAESNFGWFIFFHNWIPCIYLKRKNVSFWLIAVNESIVCIYVS